MSLRIFVVDDHVMVRRAVCDLLGMSEDEDHVFELLAEGRTDPEIAAETMMPEAAVAGYRSPTSPALLRPEASSTRDRSRRTSPIAQPSAARSQWLVRDLIRHRDRWARHQSLWSV